MANFKKVNRIVSRKITKFMSKKSIVQQTITVKASKDFVEFATRYVHHLGLEVNTDKSGFIREIYSGRTLDHFGVKKVESLMQFDSAMTHS